MFFKNSKYFNEIKSYKLELPFGDFYFTEKFVVGEVHEGEHFNWEKGEQLVAEAMDYYGKDARLAFVSNRVNHYSLDPQNWIKLDKKYEILVATSIVIYNSATYMNASIEKQFAQKNINIASSLDEAIEWVLNLKALN